MWWKTSAYFHNRLTAKPSFRKSRFRSIPGCKAHRNGLPACGSGTEKKEDDIDLSAGVLLSKKVGDEVMPGTPSLQSTATIRTG